MTTNYKKILRDNCILLVKQELENKQGWTKSTERYNPPNNYCCFRGKTRIWIHRQLLWYNIDFRMYADGDLVIRESWYTLCYGTEIAQSIKEMIRFVQNEEIRTQISLVRDSLTEKYEQYFSMKQGDKNENSK